MRCSIACRRVGDYCVLTPKMSHSFIQNCCWITLQVSRNQRMKDLCQKRKVKLIFRGAYGLSETGTGDCLGIISVGCNLKQFDGLTWLTLPDSPYFTTIYTTGLRQAKPIVGSLGWVSGFNPSAVCPTPSKNVSGVTSNSPTFLKLDYDFSCSFLLKNLRNNNNNNNNNNQDDIYWAVVMTSKSLREFTRFIWRIELRQSAADPQTKLLWTCAHNPYLRNRRLTEL